MSAKSHEVENRIVGRFPAGLPLSRFVQSPNFRSASPARVRKNEER
jgi:hypothetical protein